ncbi:MAG: DNA repair protein RecN, partial [Acidovorax sp.]|nr:DNA repair protein RecN [Acidovorax sp.]
AELDGRLTQWMQLARRYKRSPEELPGLLQGWRDELRQLDAVEDVARLRQRERQAHEAYLAAARELSRQRTKAAPRLSRAITQAMQGLGMQGGKFAVELDKLEEPSASGMDAVQFLVAGHPGATPRPIGKVASGGELSRLSLAIAVTTSQLGQAGTLIFDEVDSGVGGAVAETVGKLMRALGRDRQVLAVTHLPQVAACADQHYVVSKRRDKTCTTSSVTPVRDTEREQEVARMLGGERLSATTLAHAREMLAQASSP